MSPTTGGTPPGGPDSHDPAAGPGGPRAGGGAEPARVDPALVDLVRRPYVAEVISALGEQPHTLTELRRRTGASRQAAVDALRALASHHAVTRHPSGGSWDTGGDKHTAYRLSPAGEALSARLLQIEVWRAVFETDTPQG
jgi:DNA-binding HxlR family transcriptional regulator